jgi:hypothetical protein
MEATKQKESGAYYTPEAVVRSLVRWAVRGTSDRLLDPACGDGRFLVAHANSVGVEKDEEASAIVGKRAPGSLIHNGDFFTWAAQTNERFDCAAGNPPFIRYQRFSGDVRRAALELCAGHGVTFSSLSSSWAPFIVGAATLLRPGGRMAFVVPAEIGHAPYAVPVLAFLAGHFARVQVVAIQEKLFPDLSEDCWLLYAEGYGRQTDRFLLSELTHFGFMPRPPQVGATVSVAEWQQWRHRLRAFLLSSEVRDLYQEVADAPDSTRLAAVAKVGIGYVTGANDFFHLRPSEAERRGIPDRLLHPSVRKGKALPVRAVTWSVVEAWRRRDDPVLLLRIAPGDEVPASVRRYLDSPAGQAARLSYKCRNRNPWYVVPDVVVPDAFLSYMSGAGPSLVANQAKCVGTNSVHVVRLKGSATISELQRIWKQPFTQLSCEVEGHPLGGGMLKLEPREAGRIVLSPHRDRSRRERKLIREGLYTMRQWRHYG